MAVDPEGDMQAFRQRVPHRIRHDATISSVVEKRERGTQSAGRVLAGATGLEPATSGVTGRRWCHLLPELDTRSRFRTEACLSCDVRSARSLLAYRRVASV